MPKDLKTTDEWALYEKGLDYKYKINLFEEVDKQERFYSGNQWSGVQANGLPTPVFNIIKRVLQYKISSIMQNDVAIKYTVDSDNPELQQVAELLSKYSNTMWERLKMDSSNAEILKDAAISADGITYYYWDDTIDAGNGVMGDMAKEEIDNIQVMPGNPNDNRIQPQPYILIVFRRMVDEVKAEAKANGVSEAEILNITSDVDNGHTSGDRGKVELDDDTKCNVILKLWKNENGAVWAKKSTKNATVKKDFDTGLRRYPLAMMNWETRKNSFHGTAEVTGLIPNQIYINKIAAMLMLNTMYTAFPKLVYDSSRIQTPTNEIGSAIAVNGTDGPIRNVVDFLNPGTASPDAYKMFETAIQYTKEMMGANEAALGEVDPKNTSAIIALQQASAIPLESIRRRFYQYIEDVALIWVDFFTSKYNTPRILPIRDKDNVEGVPFDGSVYRDIQFNVKIDVGPSSRWSEITTIQTLDNLLSQGKITDIEYFERIPDGFIPDKQELIDTRLQQMQQQQAMADLPNQIQQVMQSMTPEEQQAFMQLPDEQKLQVMQQMLGGTT